MKEKLKPLTCPICSENGFKNSQALGAHNRYKHPKKAVRSIKVVRRTLDLSQPVHPCEPLYSIPVNMENFFLWFLMRRGVTMAYGESLASMLGRVTLEIAKLEKEHAELKAEIEDNDVN